MKEKITKWCNILNLIKPKNYEYKIAKILKHAEDGNISKITKYMKKLSTEEINKTISLDYQDHSIISCIVKRGWEKFNHDSYELIITEYIKNGGNVHSLLNNKNNSESLKIMNFYGNINFLKLYLIYEDNEPDQTNSIGENINLNCHEYDLG